MIVQVQNASGKTRQVLLESDTQQRMLGDVPARASRSFSLPSGLGPEAAGLRFLARNRQDTLHSSSFHVMPGQMVIWSFDDKGARPVVTH